MTTKDCILEIMEEIAYLLEGDWEDFIIGLVAGLFITVLLITSPVWIIPYRMWTRRKTRVDE